MWQQSQLEIANTKDVPERIGEGEYSADTDWITPMDSGKDKGEDACHFSVPEGYNLSSAVEKIENMDAELKEI